MTTPEPRPVTVNVNSSATEIKAGHVWTDDTGSTNGSLHFGDSWVVFHDPAQARQAAAELATLADRMDVQIAAAQAPREGGQS